MFSVMNMDLPNRKPNRLKNYDYSQNGVYFITICTKNREKLLWEDVGASIARQNNVRLSTYGKIVDNAINNIEKRYTSISVDKYVIMPNHIHLLLRIKNESWRAMLAPTTSVVVQQMKGYITKQIGSSIWQRSYHDHIIRNDHDYLEIWEYIDTNPLKWHEDCFYKQEK